MHFDAVTVSKSSRKVNVQFFIHMRKNWLKLVRLWIVLYLCMHDRISSEIEENCNAVAVIYKWVVCQRCTILLHSSKYNIKMQAYYLLANLNNTLTNEEHYLKDTCDSLTYCPWHHWRIEQQRAFSIRVCHWIAFGLCPSFSFCSFIRLPLSAAMWFWAFFSSVFPLVSRIELSL